MYKSAMVFSVLLALTCMVLAEPIPLQEAPEGADTWGYRPAENSTPIMNPPGFTWGPVKDAQGYDLQVASDDAFETVVYESAGRPWCAHCPDQAFAPGGYFWRYRARMAAGACTAWSPARSFTVPADATAFPKPAIAALKARMPQGHPRLFFRPEEVAPFWELAQGPLAERWQGLWAQADKLLKNPPDFTEPPKYPEGMAPKSGEWKKIWWGNRVRAQQAADAAALMAFLYRLSGEAAYGRAAHDWLLAVTEWDPKGATQYEYNDEAAMPMLYYPARAYTWAHDTFSPEERERICAMMRVRGEDCYQHLLRRPHLWRPYSSHSNRAWHWLGEVATAFMGEIPEAEAWLDFSFTVFFTCYPVWSDADGGWHEGLAYWSSYIQRFMYWAFISQSAFDIDPFTKPFFKETGYYGLYTVPPNTKTGGFSDQSTLMSSQSIASLMALLAVGAQNPHWQWYAETHKAGIGGYFGFIFAARAQALTAQAPADLPASRLFKGVGLAALNTNLVDGAKNIQVHFKSSPMGRQSHGYNANNAFLLNINGQPALIRSGKRDVYGSPHHSKWMWETKSDNAILVNGQGQPPHSAKATGHISVFHTTDALDVVVGEAAESYRYLDRWTRRLLFFKPGVILIHDLLEAPRASDYQWLLHAKGAFELGEAGARWKSDAGALDIQFLAPEKLRLTQTDQFDPPPHEWAKSDLNEWHLTAATIEKKATESFLTLIRINDTPVTVEHRREGNGEKVTLMIGEEKAVVDLAPDHFRIESKAGALTF